MPMCEGVGAATYYDLLLLELVVNPIIWPMKILASNNYWLSPGTVADKLLTAIQSATCQSGSRGGVLRPRPELDPRPWSLTRMSGARVVTTDGGYT